MEAIPATTAYARLVIGRSRTRITLHSTPYTSFPIRTTLRFRQHTHSSIPNCHVETLDNRALNVQLRFHRICQRQVTIRSLREHDQT